MMTMALIDSRILLKCSNNARYKAGRGSFTENLWKNDNMFTENGGICENKGIDSVDGIVRMRIEETSQN